MDVTFNNPYRARRIDFAVRYLSHIRKRNCELERDRLFQLSSRRRVSELRSLCS
jgi:hypothetical protein